LKRAIGVVFLFLNFYRLAFSTDYQFLKFRVEDGLKTDIIKAIDRDSLGFLWIGSDDGLMQYNGNRFLHYPHATESPFVKDFIKLRDGRLLVLNDLGLDEIINQIDTVIFKNILPGTRVPTDTSLWYPKSIFEDSYGNLWVSEPQSVVKYDGSSIDRIEFAPEHNSSSFVRSFSFVELPGGKILISSYNGAFFTYDNITGEFAFLDNRGFDSEVNHMLYWNGEIFLAGTNGINRLTIRNDGSVIVKQVKSIDNVSYLLPLSDTELLVSTFTSSAFIYRSDGSLTELPHDLTVVNQSFVSKEGNIWLATEKGVVLLKPEIFIQIKAESDNIYVESVVISDNAENIYFSSKEHIRKYNIDDRTMEIFDNRRNGYFLSLQWLDDHLWASNTTSIHQYDSSGNLVSEWDFSNWGRFIFDIRFDKYKTLWFTQESGIGLKSINQDGDIEFYLEDRGLNEELTVVRMGTKGIFTGSNNPESYLYFKDYDDSVFQNLSQHISFEYSGDFRINDIAVDDDRGSIWLASSIGLLRQTKSSLERLYFEEKFENMLVKTVFLQEDSPYVWFSNAYGLIQLNVETQQFNVYDESHGLPSNTINTRGLIVREEAIWVGTASGLAYSDNNFMTFAKTPRPYIVGFYADGVPHPPSRLSEIVLSPHPNIGIVVSSPTYPGNNLKYQYKTNMDPVAWGDLSTENILVFSKLKGGTYTLLFRAKKPGNFTWSDVSTYSFTVEKVFYETWYFTAIILIGVLLLIVITRYISVRILIQRQQELEMLVTERTAELEQANANLLERNQELDQFVYSTSHDLSAPLKSIRGLIKIANYETDIETQKSLLNRMNESVIKLETFIRDVISYSRNARLDVVKKEFNLKALVSEILDHISNLEHFHKINFEIDIDDKLSITSDETRVKIILNNLISNAVKFQRFDEEEAPLVRISYKFNAKKHHIKVEDNGHGIPKEYLEKIFNMFYRANVSSDGSGLGLYILKETLKKLHGDVAVHSEEGKGSEFEVYFS
jgi:signal transduction histidine kinase/ligand-binding sensor domain-containing protein